MEVEQIVEAGKLRFVLKRGDVAKQVEQAALETKFGALDLGSMSLETSSHMLLFVTRYTDRVEGAFALPNSTDDEESYRRKLTAFRRLDGDVAGEWIAAAHRVAHRGTPRALLPSGALTEEEREDRKLKQERQNAARQLRAQLTDRVAAEAGKPRKVASKPVEFVFYGDIDDRVRSWSILKRFGVLPRAGGWEDQDPEWTHDILVIDNMYIEEQNRVKK